MYTIDDPKDKFTILVNEEIHNSVCDDTIDDHITNEITNYIETGNRAHLVKAGAILMTTYIDMCAENIAKYEPISWSAMREFSHYPLIQRVKLFLEVWNRTDNSVFMIELYELLSKTYNG